MSKISSTKRGFTLIELLVVIAIIGVLSSVVLASLNSARNKGADAAIKSQLAGMRAQAELSYDSNNNSYANVCTDPTIASALSGVKSASGAATINTNVANATTNTSVNCHSSTTAWAIESPTKGSTSGINYWCVDNSGWSAGSSTVMIAANDYSCQ